MNYSKRSIWLFGLTILLFMNALLWLVYFETRDRGGDTMTVAFLDVGQGDSIYIEAPNGVQMLIDGGANRSVLRELGTVMPFWDRSLDVVIATHPDRDHIGGLIPVMRNFRVKNYLDTGLAADTETYEVLESVLNDKVRTKKEIAKRGMRIDLDVEARVYVEILEPDSNPALLEDRNDASVIARLVYGETEVMLTGDASVAVELELMTELEPSEISADVLKLGHHGSQTSTSLRFLDAVNPEIAIISAGAGNRYGHPHAEVTERLDNLGIPYVGTYAEGTIILKSNGKAFSLK